MITEYADTITYLEQKIGLGMQPGLERITNLMERMGNPQRSYPVIHLAGTNGKSSTARMLTELATSHGFRTGTFTSPHLELIEERISIDGISVTADEFTQAIADASVFAELDPPLPLSYFELLTGAALSYFSTEGVELAVVEVGLGGRLDSTNIVSGAVSVVTSIGFDHTELLGNSHREIAQEKMAIAEPEQPLVLGPLSPEAEQVAHDLSQERGLTLIRWDQDYGIEHYERLPEGWLITVAGVYDTYQDLCLEVYGRHQAINLAVAVATLEMFGQRALSAEATQEGVAAIHLPGRLEPLRTEPLVVVDGAHNSEGYAVLADALTEEFAPLRWMLVIAGNRDKQPGDLPPMIAERLIKVIATQIPGSERSLSADEVAQQVSTTWSGPLEIIPDPRRAVRSAIEQVGPKEAVLVTGSLYLGGEVRARLGGRIKIGKNER